MSSVQMTDLVKDAVKDVKLASVEQWINFGFCNAKFSFKSEIQCALLYIFFSCMYCVIIK